MQITANLEKKKFYIQITFLLFLSIIIFFPYICRGSLSSWDESIYAQAARGITRTGNWLDLYWNGTNWLDKPPLHIWTVAICYKIFGINEFATRLSSVLFGIATVIGIYLIVFREYEQNIAFISGIVLLTTLHFIRLSKLCMSDIMLSFIIMLSLYFFWLGTKRIQYFLFSGILFGLAIMTKGAVAFLIPLIVITYIIFSGQLSLIKNKFLLFGFLLGILIALPWHLFEYLHNEHFVKDYLHFHSLRRLLTPLEGHTGNWMFYIKTISNKGRPWGIIGLLGIPYLIWSYIHKKDRFLLLVLSWMLTVFVVFSFAKTKLHWYIMPIYPALSIATAIFLSKIVKPQFVWVFALLVICLTSFYIRHYDLYNLDFNNETKSFYNTTKGIIGKHLFYIYNIADPGVGFYFGDDANYSGGKANLNELIYGSEKKYILVEKQQFKKTSINKNVVKLIAESENLALFSNK